MLRDLAAHLLLDACLAFPSWLAWEFYPAPRYYRPSPFASALGKITIRAPYAVISILVQWC